MKQELIKALVVLDTRQNSWFLNGGYQESIEGPVIHVKGMRVNMEDLHAVTTLRESSIWSGCGTYFP